jgi:hypothetical protein
MTAQVIVEHIRIVVAHAPSHIRVIHPAHPDSIEGLSRLAQCAGEHVSQHGE